MSAAMKLPNLSEAAERRLLAALVSAALLLAAGPAGENPDGLEMIGLATALRGEGPDTPGLGYWHPLWPALVAVGASWLPALVVARLIGVLAAGLVVLPLHTLAVRVAGRGGARLVVLLYAGLPSVREHAAVLDARTLTTLLGLLCADAAVRALEQPEVRRRWGVAALLTTMMSLVRPEGLMVVPLMTLTGVLASGSIRDRLVRGLALGATGLPALWRAGAADRAWEGWAQRWGGVWPTPDLTALYGAASAPTDYRQFVQDLGGSPPAPDLSGLLVRLPDGVIRLAEALPTAVGSVLPWVAAVGALRLLVRARPGAILFLSTLCAGLALAPLVLLPQVWDQATPATNLMFHVPALCLLVGAALQPPPNVASRPRTGRVLLPRLLPALIVGLLLIEAHLGPARAPPPRFPGDTDMAMLTQRWLRSHPPASGRVAASLATRGVVRAAGLWPESFGSGWERWEVEVGDGVLIGSMDLRGGDGGRARMLLEDPSMELLFFTFEGESTIGTSPPPPEAHWLAYLERRAPLTPSAP